MMESEFDVKDIVVIDNGSDTIKVGVSGEDYPRVKSNFAINYVDGHRQLLRNTQHTG